MLCKQPRQQILFGERVHPDVMPDARVFVVFDVAAVCFERFDEFARFGYGNDSVFIAVKSHAGVLPTFWAIVVNRSPFAIELPPQIEISAANFPALRAAKYQTP